jgi:tRNA (Thr-GGU) A37 N-methylase
MHRTIELLQKPTNGMFIINSYSKPNKLGLSLLTLTDEIQQESLEEDDRLITQN